MAELIELTTEIVASYVSGNSVAASELPALIRSVSAALNTLGDPPAPAEEPTVQLTKAQINKSITPDALISFEDGKPYKTLKRHLSIRGLTPAAYREKWGLPSTYPMTAANYAARRSALAKSIGLGSGGRGAAPKAAAKAPRKKPTA